MKRFKCTQFLGNGGKLRNQFAEIKNNGHIVTGFHNKQKGKIKEYVWVFTEKSLTVNEYSQTVF